MSYIHVILSQFPSASRSHSVSCSSSSSLFCFPPVLIVNTSLITGDNCSHTIVLITANWLLSHFSIDCISFPFTVQLFFFFLVKPYVNMPKTDNCIVHVFAYLCVFLSPSYNRVRINCHCIIECRVICMYAIISM